MVYLALTVGPNWFYLQQPLYWLLALVLLLSGLSAWWLAGFLWRTHRRIAQSATPISAPGEPIVVPRMKKVVGIINKPLYILLIGIGIGSILGWSWRDHQLISNLWTYTDVAVVTKFADHDYLIWPDRMKQQRVGICPESTVDWHEGEVLDDWTFEQKQGCKRVVSYHEKLKGELNVAAQIR